MTKVDLITGKFREDDTPNLSPYITDTTLTTELADYVTIEAGSSTSTTVSLTEDTQHGTYASPITGNLNVLLTGAKRGVVCVVFHQSGTAPTVAGATLHAGEYDTTVINILQFYFDGTIAIYNIIPANA